MAGLYSGHLLEFPAIRVDHFSAPSAAPPLLPRPAGSQHALTTSSPLSDSSARSAPCSSAIAAPSPPPAAPRPAPPAQLYLLSHVHADHLVGLTGAFTGRIVCTPDTKRMLVRLEGERERVEHALGRAGRKRKYAGLAPRVTVTGGSGARDDGKHGSPGTPTSKGKGREVVVDYIDAVPYNHPVTYDLFEDGAPVTVTITLLDANHCPGSAMFLVTAPGRAVLHTGDVRADHVFLQGLRRNPALSPYVVPRSGVPCVPGARGHRLDRVYLDNGAILGTGDMPDKEEALDDMVAAMSVYPPDTVFFLDVWCFGWEDVVKEVARHFGVPVHVDAYKHSIYRAVHTDPYLLAATTTDPAATRFHACERRARCAACRTYDRATGTRRWNRTTRVVGVHMIEMKTGAWDVERARRVQALNDAAAGAGAWPLSLGVPIARHSTLPELQRLVSLLRPAALSPNTLAHPLGLDYWCFPDVFADALDADTVARLRTERDAFFAGHARFGPDYVRAMRAARLGGAGLLEAGDGGTVAGPAALVAPLGGRPGGGQDGDQLGGSEALRQPHAASRQAWAADQLARLVGGATTGLGSVTSGSWRGVSAGDNGATLAWRAGGTDDDDDEYDTDEERRRTRRRRRMAAPYDRLAASPKRGATVLVAPTQVAQVKTERELAPACQAPVARRVRGASRFAVDKAHLAMLAGGVKAEGAA